MKNREDVFSHDYKKKHGIGKCKNIMRARKAGRERKFKAEKK